MALRPRAGGHGAGVVRVLGLVTELAVVAFVLARLTVTALSAPVRPAEAYAVARLVAASQPDVGMTAESWPRQVFETLLSGVLSALGVFHWGGSAVTALRVVALAVAVALVALVWLLAWRLRFGPVGRALAVLTVGAAPGAVVLLAGSIRPGAFAAVFGGLALMLTIDRRPGRHARLTALLALAGMLLVVPATLAALLAAVAVGLAHEELARGVRGRLHTVLTVGVECLATAALVGLARFPVGGPGPAVPRPAGWEWLLAGTVAGLAALGLFQRRLRTCAVAGLVLVLTAAAAPAAARADLLVVALPLLAVPAVGTLEELTAWRMAWLVWVVRRAGHRSARLVRRSARRLSRLGRRSSARRPVWAASSVTAESPIRTDGSMWTRPGSGWRVPPGVRTVLRGAVSLVMAVTVLAAMVRTVAATPPGVGGTAAPAVAAWLAGEVPGDPPLTVDDLLWPQLLRAGVQVSRLRTPSGIGVRGPTDWQLVAGTQAMVSGEGWRRYAVFGTGPGQVTVFGRDEAGGPAGPPVAHQRRVELGSALARNARIGFTAQAADALRRGAVDPRLIFVLAELSGRHELRVAGFPPVDGETAGYPPLRRVLISGVDGRPASDPEATELLRRWLESQLEPYRPRAVESVTGGLLIRYALTDTDV